MTGRVQMNIFSIPQELKNEPRWVNWRNVIRGRKIAKVPINPRTGRTASCLDSATWGDFEQALRRLTRGEADGIGFQLGPPYVGIDLDKCRDQAGGAIEPWADKIIRRLDCYTEVSPSGRGLHILVKGKLPNGARRKGSIEMYEAGRYFTVTGTHVKGTPYAIAERDAELKELHAEVFRTSKTGQRSSQHGQMDDGDLIRRAGLAENGVKFTRLWAGDWGDYPSQSEADLALCTILAFWTKRHPARMDGLFRRSGLYRPKWDDKHGADGRTYGQITIDKAIAQTSQVWNSICERENDFRGHPLNNAESERQWQNARHYVSIQDLREKISRWLYIPTVDMDAIDFCLAVYFSNLLPGDPLWGLLIDASGGGKTELLRALRKRAEAYFLSTLTEKSLVSGYRDPKKPKKDPSLLPQLDGKVLIIKDLSPLLSMRRERRNTIMGDLRDAYDGFTDQGRGNLGRLTYVAKFSVLAASTLAIERFDSFDQELGERIIKFRIRADSDQNQTKVRRALTNLGQDDSMREEIEKAISEFLHSLTRGSVRIPSHIAEAMATIADFVATARSHVQRDRNHDIQYLPRPEVGTRLVKELAKLAMALVILRGKPQVEEEELRTVVRVGEDCLPPNRYAVLRCVWKAPSLIETAEIALASGLPHSTARRALEDLEALKVVHNTSSPQDRFQLWELRPEWRKRLESLGFLE